MQLKPGGPAKTAGKSGRRLLVGVGSVVVVLTALAVSLTFTLKPGDSHAASGVPHDPAVTSNPNGYSSGVGNAASGSSAGFTRHRAGDGDFYFAPTPLSQDSPTTETGVTGIAESAIERSSGAQTDPRSAYTASGSEEMPALVVAAADRDTTAVSSATTTTTAPRVTKVPNAATSWADLRGIPPSTTTTVQTVEGYRVVESVTGMQGSPAVDAFTTGGLDVFGLSSDKIWWLVIWNGEAWPEGAKADMPADDEKFGDESWEDLEGMNVTTAPGSGPASVAWNSGYTDVFVRSADDALLHRRGTTTWFAWENLGGLLSSDPTVASRAPGRLDVFARGPFDHLWHISFDGATWSEWENLGGDLASEPAAVAMDSGHLDVFARAKDGGLLHLAWSDGTGWTAWKNLGGSMTSGPGVCSMHPGRMDVFARGPNGTLWQRTYMLDACSGFHRWLPWKDLGGSRIASSPDAAAWGADNRIDVFVRGTDYEAGTDTALWHRWWDGKNWLP